MMKKRILPLLAILWLPTLDTTAQDAQTIDAMLAPIETQYTIDIHYAFDAATFFPAKWSSSPSIAATGQQADLAEVARMVPIIQAFLADHPAAVVQANLEHIYLLGDLVCGGKTYGSTYYEKSIYLPVKPIEQGYTSEFLEQRLHSEFSSILLHHHTFPSSQWTALNPSGFRYSGTGFEVVDRPTRYDISEQILVDGFLMNYSKSSMENDFNMISSWMFTKSGELDTVCQFYPKIQQKTALAEGFYESVSTLYPFN